jgi:hypothetical protein
MERDEHKDIIPNTEFLTLAIVQSKMLREEGSQQFVTSEILSMDPFVSKVGPAS